MKWKQTLGQRSRFVFVQDHTLHFKSSALFQEAFTGTEHINKPDQRHFSFNVLSTVPLTLSKITVTVLNEERDERINGDAVWGASIIQWNGNAMAGFFANFGRPRHEACAFSRFWVEILLWKAVLHASSVLFKGDFLRKILCRNVCCVGFRSVLKYL